MKNAEIAAIGDQKSASSSGSTELSLLDIVDKNHDSLLLSKFSNNFSTADRLELIDFRVPLDGSQAKALPEFNALTPQSNKTGVDGVLESVKDTINGIFGERDTLHSHVRMLARAGMTPTERQQLAMEEQQLKEYNKTAGHGLESGFSFPPKTPMRDELDRRTIALEKNIAESAKKNMTPLQVAQLESGTASAAVTAKYESQLISIVTQYDQKGAVPADVYKAAVAGAAKQRVEDEKNAAKIPDKGCLLPNLDLLIPEQKLPWKYL